jgi:hypothetical protein
VDQHISSIIEHMARSHEEMARILEAKRHVAIHMAQLIQFIPDHPAMAGAEVIMKNAVTVTENVTAYLNSIADLEESIADNLEAVMKEIGEQTDDE